MAATYKMRIENFMNLIKKVDPLKLLIGLSVLILFFLQYRNMGLYPWVFADEYIYSKFSRLLPLNESSIPGYLYLWLYSYTNYCGDSFLGCARIINAFLFVAAMPFIYLATKKIAGKGASIIVSLLAVVGPINSYTAYFMPESLYFLSFWVLCWYLLGLDSKSNRYGWLAAGMIYGLSSLVKPHSIFFFPAIFTYIGFVFYQRRQFISSHCFFALAYFLLGAIVTKFGISFILAGSSGLTIFGPFYGSIASSSTASAADKYIQLLQLALVSIKGHMLAVVLAYGLPLTIAVVVTFDRLFSKVSSDEGVRTQVDQFERVTFFSLIILLNLVCVVALFTASVAISESPYRLHMRYYNFALPLFYIVAAGALSETININKNISYLVGCIVAIFGAYAVWTNLAPYTPSRVDSPEIRGLQVDYLYFQVIGGLLIFALVLWLFFQRNGLKLYLYVALPLSVGVSTYHIGLELNDRLKQDVYDKAGIFVKQYLTNEDLSKVVIVGSEPGWLYRSLFYLDNAKASLEIIQRGTDYDLARLPDGKEWILVVGDQGIKGMPFYQVSMNGYALIRVSGENALDFKKDAWPGIIRKAKGLSTPELWGTWSQSDIVTFEFAGSLPSKFEIHLVAHAFGPNVDKEFEALVGDDAVKFSLSVSGEQKIIHLNNPNESNILRFKIPNAVSPKALGLSGDDRNLGIGFVEMKIVPIE